METPATRLRRAREKAGYETPTAAAAAFGWAYPTYAGHENGSRGMRPDALMRYAKAFRVSPAWLLDGTEDGKAQPKPRPEGFAEPDVAPYAPPDTRSAKSMTDIVKALAPAAKKPQVMVAQRDHISYGILAGDLLIISEPRGVGSGEVVVVTLADEQSGAAVTMLRQRSGDQLCAPIGQRLPDEDEMSAGILGQVVAVIRAPEIASKP